MQEVPSNSSDTPKPLFVPFPCELAKMSGTVENPYANGEITAPGTYPEMYQTAANLRALEYYIDTLMEGAPDAVSWHYLEENQQDDLVVGRLGIAVLTVEAEHRLSVVRWLGYEASGVQAVAHRIHDMSDRLMIGWAGGAEYTDQLQYRRASRNYRRIRTIEPGAVPDADDRLAMYAQLLRQGMPAGEDDPDGLLPSIHRRPPRPDLAETLSKMLDRMGQLPPEFFQ